MQLVSKEAEEIKKLQQTIDELQTELKFLQETVGVLVGAMMEEGDSEDFFGNSEAGNPSFRLNMGM
jgi:peptidoglycan hydrolase CwlO-like protein